jgi:predicted DNA-binding ArsR family transcriptional regulator
LLDTDIQRKILEKLYESWKEDFAQPILLQNLNIDGVSQEVLITNAEYLASKGLIKEPLSTQFWTSITLYGIDWIEDKRISSDVKTRKRILEILKESYEKDPYKYVMREDLVQIANLPMNEILRNVWYLDKKGLIEAEWAMGGHFDARITSKGIDNLKEPTEIEKELKIMSNAYSVLYLLENQLRLFIERKLREKHGDQWTKCIPDEILNNAEKRRPKTKDSNLSVLCYMQFGNLGLVIGKNWEEFKENFKNPGGIVNRLDELEEIRHQIAHCRLLSNDDLTKLDLFYKEIIAAINSG